MAQQAAPFGSARELPAGVVPRLGGPLLPPDPNRAHHMFHRSLLAVLLTPLLCAQTPPCISLNDANTNVGTALTAFGFGGPGVLAWQFTPSSTLVLMAAQIFT